MNDQNAKQEPPKGYRLLTAEEKTKPLPLGAIFWCQDEWEESGNIGRIPNAENNLNYAVPITPASTPADAPTDATGEAGAFVTWTKMIRAWDRVMDRLPEELSRKVSLGALDELAEHLGIKERSVGSDEYILVKVGEGETVESLERTIATLRAECEGLREWQPIETAPKTGERILGWSPIWADWFIVKWSPNRPWPFWTVDSGAVTEHAPTLWMPLPPWPPMPDAASRGTEGQG